MTPQPTTLRPKGVYDNLISGASGWGAMVLANGISIGVCSGRLDGIQGQTEAEFGAMEGAIIKAAARGHIGRASTVRIQTSCREAVAILLLLIPGTTCVGPNGIAAAGEVRGAMREASATKALLRTVHDLALYLTFEIRPTDERALAAARSEMRHARARA